MRFILLLLLSFPVFADIPKYDRGEFGHGWKDEDGDCENSRAEVLKRDAIFVFNTNKDTCMPNFGWWIGQYSAEWFFNPSKMDIDHVVPLKEAWISGAWKWNKERRVKFANDMDNLLAVGASYNRSKGSKPPHEWLPPIIGARCDYVDRWVMLKKVYGLTITAEEYTFIRMHQMGC